MMNCGPRRVHKCGHTLALTPTAHHEMFRTPHLLLAALVLMHGCSTLENRPHNPLLGAWTVKEIHWRAKDKTYDIDQANAGLLLVTPTRYAIMWSPKASPREPFAKLSAPTDAEIKAGFQSIVFNGGTYRYEQDVFITTAEVAKVPGFEGGQQFYRYELDGDQLTLTMFDETYPDGEKPEWFGRYVTEFVLQRTASATD